MRFIQVGAGAFGRGWLRRLREHPVAQLAALVDVNPDALETARRESNGGPEKYFGSLSEAFRKVEADALLCVTPPEHHRACIVRAMKAGLDVLTEKPLAAGLADCLAVLRTARETGRTCAVSQNYRFRPDTWTMSRLVRGGRIGAIGQGRLEFFLGVDFHGGFRHEMPYPVLNDMAIHHFDLLRFITGLEALSVRGEAWNPPWSNYRGDCSTSLVFEMENGAHFIYNASWCAKGAFCDWNGNWHLEGDRGTLVREEGRMLFHDAPCGYRPEGTETIVPEPMEKTNQDFVLDDFISAVRSGRTPQAGVRDNIRSVMMVLAAVRAVRTGRRTLVMDRRVSQEIDG